MQIIFWIMRWLTRNEKLMKNIYNSLFQWECYETQEKLFLNLEKNNLNIKSKLPLSLTYNVY